jgi:hypothetical protein
MSVEEKRRDGGRNRMQEEGGKFEGWVNDRRR